MSVSLHLNNNTKVTLDDLSRGIPYSNDSAAVITLDPTSFTPGEIQIALKEIYRVLKGGGTLLIDFPLVLVKDQKAIFGEDSFSELYKGEIPAYRLESLTTDVRLKAYEHVSLKSLKSATVFSPRSIKLNLGASRGLRENYITIDERERGVNIPEMMRSLDMYLPYSDDTVDEIYFLTPHIYAIEKVEFLLSEAKRVLKHKGALFFHYPLRQTHDKQQKSFFTPGAFSEFWTNVNTNLTHFELLSTPKEYPYDDYGEVRLGLVLLRS